VNVGTQAGQDIPGRFVLVIGVLPELVVQKILKDLPRDSAAPFNAVNRLQAAKFNARLSSTLTEACIQLRTISAPAGPGRSARMCSLSVFMALLYQKRTGLPFSLIGRIPAFYGLSAFAGIPL
jgi:hypothetical protein